LLKFSPIFPERKVTQISKAVAIDFSVNYPTLLNLNMIFLASSPCFLAVSNSDRATDWAENNVS